MSKLGQYRFIPYLSVLLIFTLLNAKKTTAQIIPDNTLPVNSQVQTGCTTCEINGGTIKGTNLFHSFREFSVPTNGQAFFNNRSEIQNILTRVTGNNISNIDGLIRANGNANLFFINPNGIVFGNNASLNIGGSFVASTANSIKFADGTEFNTQTSQNTPLLTITAPIGLQFGNNQGTIQVKSQGNGLQIQPNQTLALVGGDISLEGATIKTNGGRLELGSVKEAGLVNLSAINQGFLFNYHDINQFGNIQLSGGTDIDTSSISAGEIRVNTRNLQMIEGSRMISLNLGSVPGGSMTINATDTVEIIGTGNFEKAFGDVINPTTNPSELRNGFFIVNLGSESGGNFQLNTDTLIIKNAGFILVSTFGKGNGGNIDINADQSVEISDSLLATGNRPNSIGHAGNITVNTQKLTLENRGILASSALGNGKAGNIKIHAIESIDMTGGETFQEIILGAGINTNITSSTFGKSNSGNVEIITRDLTLRDQAEIITSTFNSGHGGNLTIHASSIKIFGITNPELISYPLVSGLFTSTGLGSTGDGGQLTINTQNLHLQGIAVITTGTIGTGNAGNAIINTNNLLLENGGQISALTRDQGKAGDIIVNANDIKIIGNLENNVGTGLFASSLLTPTIDGTVFNAIGNGGNILINTNSLLIKDRGIISTSTDSQGNAGNIKITTDNLQIRNKATITVEGRGPGNAGNLSINARSILLDNSATITANTRSQNTNLNQEQASINLRAQDIIMRRGSSITTNATGNNVNGGNITINTAVLAALENSDISANSTDSRGGRVIINAKGIFGTEFRPQPTLESDITATGANPQLTGTVQLNTPDLNPTSGLIELPINIVDTQALLANNICSQQQIAKKSSFVITGRGGRPPQADELISNSPGVVEWLTRTETKDKSPAVLHQQPKTDHNIAENITNPMIQQAQGWIITADGRVILTAQPANVTLQTSGLTHPSCYPSNAQ